MGIPLDTDVHSMAQHSRRLCGWAGNVGLSSRRADRRCRISKTTDRKVDLAFVRSRSYHGPWRSVQSVGPDYVPYLFNAITMERPTILEWMPLWHTHDAPTTLFVFAVSTVMLGYVAKVRRWSRLRGWLFCALAAYMALKHIRHGSIYGVIWLAYVPAWITPTPFGRSLVTWLGSVRANALQVAKVLIVTCSGFAVWQVFWQATIPTALSASSFCFPVGPVEYLKKHQVEGNVMTPFHCGAYLSWELHPAVRVSLDGRYEVAYTSEVLPEHQRFYEAQPGWESMLSRWDHDFILIPRDKDTKVANYLLTEQQAKEFGWKLIYLDESFG